MSMLDFPRIAFIGGGNMANAIMGGLLRQGLPAERVTVVEPHPETAERLRQTLGVAVLPQASADLSPASLVVWAVKPQVFAQATEPVAAHTRQALHLSVAAGIRTDSLCHWLGTGRVVRSMPNTPALVGQGMTALFAGPQVSPQDRTLVERTMAPTGQWLWVEAEPLLDAVTALSGSGPAYVFYFLEAMAQAGVDMGLSPEQAHRLAVGTFTGASRLAADAQEPPHILRQRVTSKGGTTYAAISHLEQAGVAQVFVAAMRAAQQRARELGDEFGRT